MEKDKEKFQEVKEEGLKHKVKTCGNPKKWAEFLTAVGVIAYIDKLKERINEL